MALSTKGEPVLRESSPAVSVIIPAYDAAPYVGQALGSVFSQTFPDFEVIVVNDGSPDTEELRRVLEPFRHRITYIEQENRGAAGARNSGLRVARGDLVAFLDADDLWLPDFLAEQITFLRCGGYDLVYSDSLVVGRGGAVRTYMETVPSSGEVTFESLVSFRCNVITSGVVARRQAILNVGLFDEQFRLSQDFDLWLKIAKSGGRMSYQRKVLVEHRERAASSSSGGAKSCEAGLHVLETLPRRVELTPGEHAVVDRSMALLRAEIELGHAKARLSDGDYAGASQALRKVVTYYRGLASYSALTSRPGDKARVRYLELFDRANRFLIQRRVRLSLALLLLESAPGLLRWVYEARNRLLSHAEFNA